MFFSFFLFSPDAVGRSFVLLHNSGEGRLRIPGFVFAPPPKKNAGGGWSRLPARVSLQLKRNKPNTFAALTAGRKQNGARECCVHGWKIDR